MGFDRNAPALLREAVASIAPDAAGAECPVEALTERQYARIRLHVARRLFGKWFPGSLELAAYLKKGDYPESSAKMARLTRETLPLDGIGEDSFYLNEYYGDGPSLSSFVTLRDWDRHTHDTQESYQVEDGNRPDGPRPYEGRLLWDWSRWLDEGRLVYGNLSVAASHLARTLDDYAGDLARERYNTNYVEGPEHGARTERGTYRWDMVETPRDKAALRFATDHVGGELVNGWMEAGLRSEIERSGVWVARRRRDVEGEINEDLVFSGPEAMAAMRFRHWKTDLAAIADGTAIYGEIESKAKNELRGVMKLVFAAAEVAAESLEGDEKLSWKSISTMVLECMGGATADRAYRGCMP